MPESFNKPATATQPWRCWACGEMIYIGDRHSETICLNRRIVMEEAKRRLLERGRNPPKRKPGRRR